MCLFVALFSCPHQQQHIRQSINDIEQLPSRGVELIRCRSLFRGCSARGDACEFDVVGLKFRRSAEVDLEFVETFANILNSGPYYGFLLRGLVRRRGSTSASRLLNRGNAAGHSSQDIHEFGQVLDLVGYAGRALRSHLHGSLVCCRRRRLLPARTAARLRERRRGSQKNQSQ